MSYRAVILDFDGVVVELPDADALHDAIAAACRRVGIQHVVEETAQAFRNGNIRSLADHCQSAGVEFTQLRASAASAVADSQLQAVAAGIREQFEDVAVLRDIDKPVAVVTDNHPHAVRYLLDWFGLSPEIDVLMGCPFTPDGFERRKPSPDNLHAAVDELGTRDALVVGDRPRDIAAADNAGLDAALLVRDDSTGTDPIAVGDEPNVEPAHVLSSLAELETLL